MNYKRSNLINSKGDENKFALTDFIQNSPIVDHMNTTEIFYKDQSAEKNELSNINNEIKNKDCVYLKYSKLVLMSCWSHLNHEELEDLQVKLDKYQRCSIKKSEKNSNRYFCNECDLEFDLCFDRIVKHTMLAHCNIPRMMVDELMILGTVDGNLQLLPDKEIISKIIAKRLEICGISDKTKINIRKNKNTSKGKNVKQITLQFNDKDLVNNVKEEEDNSQLVVSKKGEINEIEMQAGMNKLNQYENIDKNNVISLDNKGEKNHEGERTEFVEMNCGQHEQHEMLPKEVVNISSNLSFTKDSNNIISLRYSQRVFRKCFKHIDPNKYQEIKRKMKKYETCSIKKCGIKYNRYICKECGLVTCLHMDKVMKHIIIDHCQIPQDYIDEIIILTSLIDDNQLISDKEMISKINEKRIRDGKYQWNPIMDNDVDDMDNESENNDNETECIMGNSETSSINSCQIGKSTNRIPFSNKFKKRNVLELKYSQRVFQKCFSHFDSDQISEIKTNLEKFTIRKNGVKKIRYFCNQCNASATSNVNKILNHILTNHCQFPDEYREEVEVLISLNKDLELISDSLMITKINLIRSKKSDRNYPEITDSDNELNPMKEHEIEELKTIAFNYCQTVFEICFSHLSMESRMELARKIDNINKYPMKMMRDDNGKYYQCTGCCSFRHYTKAHNNFHPLKKHLLDIHCGISQSFIDECLLLIGSKSNFTITDEKYMVTIINKFRSKEKDLSKKLPLISIYDEDKIDKLTNSNSRKRNLPDNFNDEIPIVKRKKENSNSTDNQICLSRQKSAGNQNNEMTVEKNSSENNMNEFTENQLSIESGIEESFSTVTEYLATKSGQDNNKSFDESILLADNSNGCGLIDQFNLNYSEILLKILCCVEMKTEFYADLIKHISSILDMKFTFYREGNIHLYCCSMCSFRTECGHQLMEHVILYHSDIPDDLKSIVGNVIIVPIIN